MKSLRLLILIFALRARSAECKGFFLWPELSEQSNSFPFLPLEFEGEYKIGLGGNNSAVFQLSKKNLWYHVYDAVIPSSSTIPTLNLIPGNNGYYTMSYGEYYILFFRKHCALRAVAWHGPYVVHRSNNSVYDSHCTDDAVWRRGVGTLRREVNIIHAGIRPDGVRPDEGPSFFIFTFSQPPMHNLLPNSFGEIYSGMITEIEANPKVEAAFVSDPKKADEPASSEYQSIKRGSLGIHRLTPTNLPKTMSFDARRSNDLPGAILLCLKQALPLENGADFRCGGYAKTNRLLMAGGPPIYSAVQSTNLSSEGNEGKGKTTMSSQSINTLGRMQHHAHEKGAPPCPVILQEPKRWLFAEPREGKAALLG